MTASFDDVWQTLSAQELVDRATTVGLDATLRPFELAQTTAGQTGGGASPAPAAPLPLIDLGDDQTTASELQPLEVLGEGGMGRVLRARQRSLGRDVAVKVPHPGPQHVAVVTALLAEARITGRLEHPGIVPVHALGRDSSSRPVLVMKRVEGVCWRELIADPDHPAWARLGTLPADRLAAHLQILMETCNAVAFAHSHGVLHRDIKPDNVMVGYFGEVYLVDWGVACERPQPGDAPADGADGSLRGSPAYMAPEMVTPSAGALCERTDVYLLGATLHEVLTRRPPHDGDNAYQVLLSAYQSRPPTYPSDVPEELAAICRQAMAADPDERFATALDFRAALSDFLDHRSSVELSTTLQPKVQELEARLTTDDPDDEQLQEAETLFSECRFGSMHALRQWSDNPHAKQLLTRVLGLMIDHRLSRGEVDAASGLLPDLPEPNPELEARVERARVDRERQRRENTRLRSLARDLDMSVSRRERVLFFGALTLFVVGETGALVWLRMGDLWQPTHGGSIALVASCLGFLLLAIYAGRRALLRNAINRRIVWSVVVWSVAALAGRVVSAAVGVPVAHALLFEMLILAACAAGAAVTLVRWVGWIAAIFAAGVAIGAWKPHWTPELVMGSTSLALLTAMIAWRIRGRGSRAAEGRGVSYDM